MLIFYPKYSAVDLLLLRSPGAGLGNLLFTWARTELYSKKTDGYAIAPTWRNIKIGTFLRWERDKRIYGDLFRHRAPTRILKDAGLRARTRMQLSEDEYLNGKRPPAGEDAVVTVWDIRDCFSSISGHSDYLHQRLRESARRTPVERGDKFIGLHIRCGDFAPAPALYKRNSRVAVDWFVSELQRIRNHVGALPATIFTDDTTGEVERSFAAVDCVSFAEPGNALDDIFQMSAAHHLILSNSTFSLWAAFLGKGTVSARYRELFQDYGLSSAQFVKRIV